MKPYSIHISLNDFRSKPHPHPLIFNVFNQKSSAESTARASYCFKQYIFSRVATEFGNLLLLYFSQNDWDVCVFISA